MRFIHRDLFKRKMFSVLALMLLLTVSIMPVGAVSTARNVQGAPVSRTFTAAADARVQQSNPNSNYGNDNYLLVDGASDPDIESFIRFTISGIAGSIQSARLRVYVTTNESANGPAAYGAKNTWTETGITWNNRPARTSNVLDNKGSASRNTWLEYNVTVFVTGNGTYTFVLVADSNDAVRLSSREGSQPPQLVVTFNSSTATPTQASVATATRTPTRTRTPTATLTSAGTATRTSTASRTPTATRTPAGTATLTPTRTPTRTRTPTSAPTSSGSVILVGAGDIASCSRNQDEQTAQLLDNIPGTVFTAGDNAYPNGTYTEYINCYDSTWGRHKSRTKPSPGNHEYETSGAAGYFQYFENTPSYYAYDLGAWRIYSLNSEISVSATSPQVTWLQNDLAANPRQCVMAYWHKPRWSSGSNHGNHSTMQILWQVLYNAGAELVINSHEHHYERFAQMNASGTVVSQGLREIVVGTGGAALYPFGASLAASQVRNNTTYGVLKLTLSSTGYDWQFVPVSGSTFTDSGSSTCH